MPALLETRRMIKRGSFVVLSPTEFNLPASTLAQVMTVESWGAKPGYVWVRLAQLDERTMWPTRYSVTQIAEDHPQVSPYSRMCL